MAFKDFWENAKHVLKVSTKPTREEYWKDVIRLLKGVVLLGLIGYVIKFLAIYLFSA